MCLTNILLIMNCITVYYIFNPFCQKGDRYLRPLLPFFSPIYVKFAPRGQVPPSPSVSCLHHSICNLVLVEHLGVILFLDLYVCKQLSDRTLAKCKYLAIVLA